MEGVWGRGRGGESGTAHSCLSPTACTPTVFCRALSDVAGHKKGAQDRFIKQPFCWTFCMSLGVFQNWIASVQSFLRGRHMHTYLPTWLTKMTLATTYTSLSWANTGRGMSSSGWCPSEIHFPKKPLYYDLQTRRERSIVYKELILTEPRRSFSSSWILCDRILSRD